MSEVDEHMLTTEQVSRWLGIATRTVCTWAECDQLPAIRVGRQWRFRQRDIIVWLQQSQLGKLTSLSAATAAPAAPAAYSFPRSKL